MESIDALIAGIWMILTLLWEACAAHPLAASLIIVGFTLAYIGDKRAMRCPGCQSTRTEDLYGNPRVIISPWKQEFTEDEIISHPINRQCGDCGHQWWCTHQTDMQMPEPKIMRYPRLCKSLDEHPPD